MNIAKNETQESAIGLWVLEWFDGDVQNESTKLGQLNGKNLITTLGKGLTLDRLFGLSASAAITGMSVGTSATAAAVGDTSITTPTFKVFDATPTRTGLVVTCITTYATTEANVNIQEVGLLTASASTLFNRLAPIGPFNKTSAVSLKITVTITQT